MSRAPTAAVSLAALLAGCATTGTKSPTVARGLSVAATAVTVVAPLVAALAVDGDSERGWLVAAGVGGTLISPSLGHFYSGDDWTRGLSYRLGGLAVGGAVAGIALVTCVPLESEDCGGGLANVALAAGALLFLLGVGDDLATADDAARAANRTTAPP